MMSLSSKKPYEGLLKVPEFPQTLIQQIKAEMLQCDYYNRGHLDKVDKWDYRKTTIYSRKVSLQS